MRLETMLPAGRAHQPIAFWRYECRTRWFKPGLMHHGACRSFRLHIPVDRRRRSPMFPSGWTFPGFSAAAPPSTPLTLPRPTHQFQNRSSHAVASREQRTGGWARMQNAAVLVCLNAREAAGYLGRARHPRARVSDAQGSRYAPITTDSLPGAGARIPPPH